MSLKIWPHNPGSRTARELAQRLRCGVLSAPETSRYTPSERDIIINYGNSRWTNRITEVDYVRNSGYQLINKPYDVDIMSNKLNAFDRFSSSQHVRNVPYTSQRTVVERWLSAGFDVIARHQLRGHSGQGIEILKHEDYVRNRQPIPSAPLYTQYVKKNAEYRVHMFRQQGGVNFIWQQKRRDMNCAEPNWAVRNYENGFIYCVDNVTKPANWEEIQLGIAEVVSLDFSATDLLTPNSANSRAIRDRGPMVLEVNSAPGLQSETLLSWYVSNIQEKARDARR